MVKSWEETRMKLAEFWAERSHCRWFQVGIVFFDGEGKMPLSVGYNGPPKGEPHCDEVGCAKVDKDGNRLPSGSGLCRGAHAEMNAIANAVAQGIKLQGTIVYSTFTPCYDCAKALIQLKIKEFVYKEKYLDEDPKVFELFERQGIKIRQFKKRRLEMEKVLNPVDIEARDLPEAWFLCIKELFEKGRRYKITKSSAGEIERLEFDFVKVHILNPGSRPLISDVPLGVPVPAEMKYVEEKYMFYLMTGEKKESEDYTYGQFLEKQMLYVIDYYKKHGFGTNHCCMIVGTPESIFAYETPGKTSPCLRIIDTCIKGNPPKLHFSMVYFRSWDLWAGFPTNLAGLQLMKEQMAKAIGVEDGEMIVASKGLHLYDWSWKWAERVLKGG